MSASSVSGVGQGSAAKIGMKGAEDMFLGVEKLIGTRVVFSGTMTLNNGTQTMSFPWTLPGVASDYMVLTTAVPQSSLAPSGAAGHVSYGYLTATNAMLVIGTGTDVVNFAVVRVTNATVASYPTVP